MNGPRAEFICYDPPAQDEVSGEYPPRQLSLPLFLVVEGGQGGFTPLTHDTYYWPNQLFDVIIPNSTPTCTALVAFMLTQTFCYRGKDGTPSDWYLDGTIPQIANALHCSERSVRNAIHEAKDKGYIICEREPAAKSRFSPGWTGRWRLSLSDNYSSDISSFSGFYTGKGHRTPVPKKFYTDVLLKESALVIKYVACVIRHTVGFEEPQDPGRRRLTRRIGLHTIMKLSGIANKTRLIETRRLAAEKCYVGFTASGDGEAPDYGLIWKTPWDGRRVPDRSKDGTPSGDGHSTSADKINDQEPGKDGTPASNSDRSRKGWYPDPGKNGTHIPARMVHHASVSDPGKDGTPINMPEGQKQNIGKQQTETERLSAAAELLRSFGIDQAGVRSLMLECEIELIDRQLEYHPYWLKQIPNVKNPAGLLRRHIEENSPPPENYEEEQARMKKNGEARESSLRMALYVDNRGDWENYVLEEYERLTTAEPDRHQRFLDYVDERWHTATKSIEGPMKDKMLQTTRTLFQRRDKQVERIRAFYKDDVQSFSEWAESRMNLPSLDRVG